MRQYDVAWSLHLRHHPFLRDEKSNSRGKAETPAIDKEPQSSEKEQSLSLPLLKTLTLIHTLRTWLPHSSCRRLRRRPQQQCLRLFRLSSLAALPAVEICSAVNLALESTLLTAL